MGGRFDVGEKVINDRGQALKGDALSQDILSAMPLSSHFNA
jgi:hypothetical protein